MRPRMASRDVRLLAIEVIGPRRLRLMKLRPLRCPHRSRSERLGTARRRSHTTPRLRPRKMRPLCCPRWGPSERLGTARRRSRLAALAHEIGEARNAAFDRFVGCGIGKADVLALPRHAAPEMDVGENRDARLV